MYKYITRLRPVAALAKNIKAWAGGQPLKTVWPAKKDKGTLSNTP